MNENKIFTLPISRFKNIVAIDFFRIFFFREGVIVLEIRIIVLLHPTCRLLKCKRELQTVQFALIPRTKVSFLEQCLMEICVFMESERKM